MALKEWIVRAKVAKTDQEIINDLLNAGWSLDVIESNLNDVNGVVKIETYSPSMDVVNVVHTPTVNNPILLSEPYPSILRGDNTIDCGDRTVNVLLEVKLPKLVVIDNFLSSTECDAIISGAVDRLARSTVVDTVNGSRVDDIRTSYGMFYSKAENTVISTIEERMSKLVDWPVANGEALQVLRYAVGAEYKPHNDYFSSEDPSQASNINRGGNRIATILTYLNDVPAGGGTIFPEMGIEVRPKKGMAIFFGYTACNQSTMSLHGGSPVVSGEKWVAVKWLRGGEFN